MNPLGKRFGDLTIISDIKVNRLGYPMGFDAVCERGKKRLLTATQIYYGKNLKCKECRR